MAENSSHSITQFVSAIQSKGVARPNLFEVEPAFPTNLFSRIGGDLATAAANVFSALQSTPGQNNFKFYCRSASLPTASFGDLNLPYRGRTLTVPGDREYQPWTITVMNDVGFTYRNLFHAWQESINDPQTNASPAGDTLSLNLLIDWKVRQLDRVGNTIAAYNLHSCWPKNVGEIRLSQEENNTVETFDVTLTYLYWTKAAVV